MMSLKEATVIASARLGVDLDNLTKSNGPLSSPCGSAGPSIANSVKEGNGKANVKLSFLKIAMETQDGVAAILDNFELTDSKTKKPMISVLIGDYLSGLI